MTRGPVGKVWAIACGRKTGVFFSLDLAIASTTGYSGANMKKFGDQMTAEFWLDETVPGWPEFETTTRLYPPIEMIPDPETTGSSAAPIFTKLALMVMYANKRTPSQEDVLECFDGAEIPPSARSYEGNPYATAQFIELLAEFYENGEVTISQKYR